MTFNPHPPLTGFPPVILTLLFLAELFHLLGWTTRPKEIRFFLLMSLMIITPLTYYSGFYGLDAASGVPSDAIKLHQGLGRAVLLSLIPLILFGYLLTQSATVSARLQTAYRVFLVASLLLSLFTSFFGGELVFSHAAGVDLQGLEYRNSLQAPAVR